MRCAPGFHARRPALPSPPGAIVSTPSSVAAAPWLPTVTLPIPFCPALAPFQPIENYRLADLAVNRERPHPIWEGVDPQDLTFRRGVAGFYGRGWHQPPEGAAVHSSLGRRRLPLDFTYRLGRGRVLFHGGNDIWQFSSEGDSTRRIVPQLVGWLLSAEPTA